MLTEEQKEKIRQNRERALELRRKREKEQLSKGAAVGKEREKEEEGQANKRSKNGEEEEEEVELEEFEVGASKFVSKKEAKQMYCLPDGTLEVCSFVEKDNPHHKGWTPMKLYKRAEIRRRARKRFEGLEGLIAERKKRADRRLYKDLEDTKDIFKN
mmetsp:Transcript_15540/g.25924  ORF Transcript_15540/g.25924 Transcript_15540/m.25924 type:complete len:157 (-) Transcript_15540:19-489(-)|eukprot:CAMPEP_0119014440 /NCGR_PEP_ID=MMETSP1176-20130426/9742_1 /TAXON_ID=265551 /ORGANISM="Synedropsis recta cf, Strain CCMP1620" /LENGTH=156 /DNA_ID=CAMNT_0006967619 /DNA_START=309 /DNA_END=779 /DNA_ORIENTATION=+